MASSSKPPSLAQIAQGLMQSTIKNIIHDTVIHRHRDHKMMLMSLNPDTKLPHCDRCNLPRLLDPPLAAKVRGATSDPPASTQYCERRPWCRAPGYDIYGNPFPKGEVTGRPPTKKEREAAKQSKKEHEGTPASNEGGDANGTAPPSPSQDGEAGGAGEKGAKGGGDKLEKGEKKANKIDEKLKKGEYIPWQTCPSCKRSLLITRFAKHLEQCMGLAGRGAARNAMAKMNGATPSGSRGGTPGPGGSQEGKDGDDEDEEEKITGPGGVRKKLLKKGLTNKLKKESKDSPTSKGNAKLAKSLASKRPPQPPSTSEGKRDRDEMEDPDDDEDNVHVKKRQKLQRVASTASVTSQLSSAPPMSALEPGGGDSADGSFVDQDDGSGGDD